MKPFLCLFVLAWLVGVSPVKGQTVFRFPTVHSPTGCTYTYDIGITIQLDSVVLTNIYFDDGTNGSFAFKTYFSYDNVFSNSTLPPGNFFTFDLTVYSDNPDLTTPSLTNNLGTVPLATAAAGGYNMMNNPTYNASASALGLVLGGSYNSPSVLTKLGYDSAVLRINLPCLDTTITANDAAALPVLWSSLKAACRGNEVTLTWQTFTEQQNAGFYIEQSTGGAVWVETAFVPSQAPEGNSSATLFYRYVEPMTTEGFYYYRIVQRDYDGRTTISNIAGVRVGGPAGAMLQVYPNPASSEIRLTGVTPNAQYAIYDAQGKLAVRGQYRQTIDLSGLSAGVYCIQVDKKVVKFVVK